MGAASSFVATLRGRGATVGGRGFLVRRDASGMHSNRQARVATIGVGGQARQVRQAQQHTRQAGPAWVFG